MAIQTGKIKADKQFDLNRKKLLLNEEEDKQMNKKNKAKGTEAPSVLESFRSLFDEKK